MNSIPISSVFILHSSSVKHTVPASSKEATGASETGLLVGGVGVVICGVGKADEPLDGVDDGVPVDGEDVGEPEDGADVLSTTAFVGAVVLAGTTVSLHQTRSCAPGKSTLAISSSVPGDQNTLSFLEKQPLEGNVPDSNIIPISSLFALHSSSVQATFSSLAIVGATVDATIGDFEGDAVSSTTSATSSHSPRRETPVNAALAKHALLYVVLSQPHTGSKISIQFSGISVHVPMCIPDLLLQTPSSNAQNVPVRSGSHPFSGSAFGPSSHSVGPVTVGVEVGVPVDGEDVGVVVGDVVVGATVPPYNHTFAAVLPS